MNFKEAYKFPLKWVHGMVFTQDSNKAFDFANEWSFDNPVKLDDEGEKKLISIINGDERKITVDLKPSLEDGLIYCDVNGEKKELILVRGWGMLTGTGGLNLPDEEAAKIQDDFANYIVERLTQAYEQRTTTS